MVPQVLCSTVLDNALFCSVRLLCINDYTHYLSNIWSEHKLLPTSTSKENFCQPFYLSLFPSLYPVVPEQNVN